MTRSGRSEPDSAIAEATPQLETTAQQPLHVRVGIATGIVIVGEVIGFGEAHERTAVGATPNLAARLQTAAKPDSVVIAEGTRNLIGDLFEVEALRPLELKGVAGKVRAYAVLRESSQESRFEALRAGALTTLVGRDEEIRLLMRRWEKAKAGEGQVVLLSGEAGIGKSRLAAAFLENVTGEPHVLRRYFCSPQHTNTPLYPIIGHLERAAGLAREDDPKTKLDNSSVARQILDVWRGRRAFGRNALPAERRTPCRSGSRPARAPAKDTRSIDPQYRDHFDPRPSAVALRGRTLGRSFEPWKL